VGEALPVMVLARVGALRKCQCDRQRGRQGRQLHPDTPSVFTRVLSLSADKKLAQTVRFERVAANENASLNGEARGRHSIARRLPVALIRMARIYSAASGAKLSPLLADRKSVNYFVDFLTAHATQFVHALDVRKMPPLI
jgi:hypothetical protein